MRKLLSPGGLYPVFDRVLGFMSMPVQILKRLRHNLGLTISTVLGIVAVLSIVVCIPIFSHAVSSRVLRQQLAEKELSTHRGLFSFHMYYQDKDPKLGMNIAKADYITQYITANVPQYLGLKISRLIPELQSNSINWVAEKPKNAKNPDDAWLNMAFVTNDIVPANGKLIEGQWPEAGTGKTGPIQVAILEDAADKYFLNIGDRFKYKDIEIEISGFWQPVDPQAQVWFDPPNTGYIDKLWVPKATYQARLANSAVRPVFYISWYLIIDPATVKFERATQYARGIVRLDSDLRRLLPGFATDYSPTEALDAYQQRAESMITLFYAVGAPMIVLALLFISLTATIAVQQHENEIATMRGRGTSRMQVIGLNLGESILLILIAIPLSLIVGWLAAGVMGKTLSFLRFTSREGIPFSLEGLNLAWLAGCSLLIIAARFLPVLGISRTTIVRLKQEQARGQAKPLWERFYLDFFMLLPGIYAYVTMKGMASPAKVLSFLHITESDRFRDLLLYVAPALFAMAVCMIALRILPLVLRLVAAIVDRLPGVWAQLSLQQIARRPRDHASALLLIMISLSLAIFSASTARTLDKWLYDSTYYASGSDLSVQEYTMEGGGPVGPSGSGGGSGSTSANLQEAYLSVEDHLKLPTIQNATRVGKYDATFSYGVGEKPCMVMGIDRLDFPRVAFFRSDFAGESLGALMNALAAEPKGVLLPDSLLKEIGLRIGDRINVSANIADVNYELEMVIVGTYHYFPTVMPDDPPTLIANLESIFDNPDSVADYQMWLNIKPGTDVALVLHQLRQLIGQDRAVVDVKGNAAENVKESMDQPERVGLFGVLNVGFLMTGLMPGIGFVLYSYASLRRRFIQLGILQAIGLSVYQLIGYLAFEQFLLMGLAISSGAIIGLATSYLFVPLLQTGVSSGAIVPPFDVIIGWAESAWLSLGFGLVLFVTMLGTIIYLARIKVFQAVKLGETV